MTFFASLVLVFVLVIRPQEIWPALNALHLLEVFTGLVVLGLLVELALRRQKHLYSPQLPFLAGFIFLCYFLSALNLGMGRGMTLGTNRALIPAVFMLAVMYGARTLPRLKTVLWLLLLLGVFVSAVAVHQGRTPPVCLEKITNEDGEVNPDPETSEGRVCTLPSDCRDPSREDVEWACEHLGLFNTFSIGRRVRWRGQLDDPNELSVFLGAVIPLLFAMGMPTRKSGSELGGMSKAILITIAVVMLGLALYAVILSQSRGGQLVVATVFGMYFVYRFRTKGLIVALLFSLPVLLLGGRDDAGAEDSSAERFELLYEGINLVLANGIKGVGVDQFPDRVQASVHLTAHNSYVLTAAEIGFPGFFCWAGILWTSFKIPFTALRRSADELTPQLRSMAMALVVSFAGISVGIFFLSFTYKQLLFVWFGLSGALYGVMKEAYPDFEVKIGKKDYFGIAFANVAIIALIFLYTRLKGGR